jgi:hypothetical protein
METLRCLAIGVSDAPPLEFLQGAENGAKAFGAWAKSLGITTEILTDENEPIGFDTIKSAFDRLFAGRPQISRLLLYFAGHGLARDAAEDLWLLSKWSATQRAVAVAGLSRRLERYGVKQLTIISDACRSPAASADSADLVADPVLDKGPFDARAPLIDMLRASSPFHAAYMIRGRTPEEDRCIFSALMNEALSGAHDAAFEAPDLLHVSNFSLADFLSREVPLRASQYGVELHPHITTGLRPPDNIYVASRPSTPPALAPWPPPGSVGSMGTAQNGRSTQRGWSTASDRSAPASEKSIQNRTGQEQQHQRPQQAQEMLPLLYRDGEHLELKRRRQKREVRRYLASYALEGDRPTHFETGSGFNIAGSEVAQTSLGRFAFAVPDQVPSWWRVQPVGAGYLRAPAPLLIEFRNGNWGGAAALPHHIATFTIQRKAVVSVIYRPVNAPPRASRETEVAVAQLRAGLLSTEAGYDLAAQLRDAKERDPVRGVIAAYIYDSLGDLDSVRRIAYYLALAEVPVPYDIALLGRLTARRLGAGPIVVEIPETPPRTPRSPEETSRSWTSAATPRVPLIANQSAGVPVAGAFPWLRQGWLLLEDEDPSDLIIDGLAKVRAELLPSPFTTLTARGGKQLKAMIEEA